MLPQVKPPGRHGHCSDGATCHHACLTQAACHRVYIGGPLSGVFHGDVWPLHIRKAAWVHLKPRQRGRRVPGGEQLYIYRWRQGGGQYVDRCQAQTKGGEQCANPAYYEEATRCHVHPS